MDPITCLVQNKDLPDSTLVDLLDDSDPTSFKRLQKAALNKTLSVYGPSVFIRGLIEISNYCVQNCYYCGIRAGNTALERYRLDIETILSTVQSGYDYGLRTFVLQGGEDPYYTDEKLSHLIRTIKKQYNDVRVTLSLGIRSASSLDACRQAGADRYLLRHETADDLNFSHWHPSEQSPEVRRETLFTLKGLGYTVGSGFLVGAPGTRTKDYVKDLRFLQKLQPEMIGIGPFLPHADTPFKDEPAGSLSTTLKLLSILRLMFPTALLPSTTALNSLCEDGRVLGLKHGANVLMPNLSPVYARRLYRLYDHKKAFQLEGAEDLSDLNRLLNNIGRTMDLSVGDPKEEE